MSSSERAGGAALCYVALGANLGDRRATITAAAARVGELAGTRVLRVSALIENPAVGGPPGQPDYLNGVAEIESRQTPRDLLGALLAIEAQLGRVRSMPNAARAIDLDLLLYADRRIAEPGLTIPHPRMWQRAFVLEPLRELIGAERLAALRARLSRP